MPTLLLIQNNTESSKEIDQQLKELSDHHIITVANAWHAIDYGLWGQKPVADMILYFLSMDSEHDKQTIQALRHTYPEIPILAIFKRNEMKMALEAIKSGVTDFITLPVSKERLHLSIRNLLKSDSDSIADSSEDFFGTSLASHHYRGFSDAMQHVLVQARQTASHDKGIIISGEAGVGKTTLARAIHYHSKRKEHPCIITSTDHDVTTLKSHINDAAGGTFVVSHKGEISDAFMRALQELYSLSFHQNIRIIMCQQFVPNQYGQEPNEMLHQNLPLQIQRITIPPLRNRRSDILLLAERWLQFLSRFQIGSPNKMDSNVRKQLTSYHWPGNLRELQCVLLDAASRCEGDEIKLQHLQLPLMHSYQQETSNAMDAPFIPVLDTKGELRSLKDMEEDIIIYALQNYRSRSDIARKLGIGRTTLYRKAQQMEKAS